MGHTNGTDAFQGEKYKMTWDKLRTFGGKRMKKHFLLTVICCFTVLVFSSLLFAEDAMIIRFKNGQTQTIRLETVQGIEFSGGVSIGTGGMLGLVSGKTYEIVAKHSGKCLDVAGIATHNGANIHQWECHGGPNQRWLLTDKGGGFYTVMAQHSNKCMDVEGIGNENGKNISQYDCHGGPNQLWMFAPQGGGYWRITAKHSNKCLDVAGGGKGDGDNIQQWDCHGGDNQLWLLK